MPFFWNGVSHVKICTPTSERSCCTQVLHDSLLNHLVAKFEKILPRDKIWKLMQQTVILITCDETPGLVVATWGARAPRSLIGPSPGAWALIGPRANCQNDDGAWQPAPVSCPKIVTGERDSLFVSFLFLHFVIKLDANKAGVIGECSFLY